jgi:hypothetical protein
MKLLTDNTLNSVVESNGAFPYQMSPRGSESNVAVPRVRILADGGNAADRLERPKASIAVATLGLAVFAVIGTASLWGWVIMHLAGLFL